MSTVSYTERDRSWERTGRLQSQHPEGEVPMRDGSEGCWEDNFMVEAGSHRSLTDPHKRKYRPKGTWEMDSEREILEICVETSLPIN